MHNVEIIDTVRAVYVEISLPSTLFISQLFNNFNNLGLSFIYPFVLITIFQSIS